MSQCYYQRVNPTALSKARLPEAFLEEGVRAGRTRGCTSGGGAAFSRGINSSPPPDPTGGPSEAAGWMRHPHRAERENKWHSSVLKLKRKQGASTFHDNYQILEMYCSFPTPKTLLGAPAVLIMFCAPLPGPEVLFQDKGFSSVFVLVSHQHLKPSSPTCSWGSVFSLGAERNKKQQNTSSIWR